MTSEEQTASMMASLKQQRSSTKGNITRISNAIDAVSSYNIIELECRLDIVSSYIKQIMHYQDEIEKLDSRDDKRPLIEELCVSTKSKILTKLGRTRTADQSVLETSVNMPRASRLPLLKLPKFNGKYAEYQNFASTFKTLVHNETSLSEIEKFNHLLSCLSGDALLTVQSFQVSPENYSKAIDRLDERYNKKCLIFFDSVSKMFEIPKMTKPNASELRNAVDTVSAIFDSMMSLGTENDITNALIIHLVLSKVDNGTKAKWNDQLDYSKLPTWSDCAKTLIRRCQTLEVNEDKPPRSDKCQYQKKQSDAKTTLTCSLQTVHRCLFCKSDNHYLSSCEAYRALKFQNKFEFAKTNSLCLNCLRKGHFASNCKSSRCRTCQGLHHTVLHRSETSPQTQPLPSTEATHQLPVAQSHTVMHTSSDQNVVVLGTSLVQIKDRFGNLINIRALLDSGSQINLITQEFANRLELQRSTINVRINCVGQATSSVSQKVLATIKSRLSDFQFESEFHILKSITSLQPEVNIPIDTWNIPSNVMLADPMFYKQQKIDLLLGAETFFNILDAGQIQLTDSLPMLQNTKFGWIVSGKYTPAVSATSCHASVSQEEDDLNSLNTIVHKLWEFEEVSSIKKKFYTQEQELCEQHFSHNTKLLESGRFEVSLPFKKPPTVLGHSFETAKRRLISLERKLLSQPDVLLMYNEFMTEYLSLGHMSPIVEVDMSKPHYYIPHQVVMRPESTSTKLRVVFDASSKTSSHISLNETLMVGPTIQPELYDTLLRFRYRRFAITADITKMYRQIMVTPPDRKFQLILWRQNKIEPIKTYQLNTVTYGTASAPFLAIRCLKELSDRFSDTLPLGSRVIREDFYVDDLLSGADTVEDLNKIVEQANAILNYGGFRLSKWFSNCTDHGSNNQLKSLEFNGSDATKALGINWNPNSDMFEFKIPNDFATIRPTKRNILSVSARLFDPLGLLCPIIMRAKVLLQDLWLKKLGWDDIVPQELHSKWQKFKDNLANINQIQIPRFVNTRAAAKVQIHGFADASSRGYGCCLYVRSQENNKITIRLLTAKSKVAPLKTKTLPRLELCAAHLLSQLWKNIELNLREYVETVTFWSDSEIVLYWIKDHPSTLNTFVANRVSDIQEWTHDIQWRYVPTADNPADIVSRGCDTNELSLTMWFTGPNFLMKGSEYWPISKRSELSEAQTNLEKRKIKVALTTTNSEFNIIIDIINRFSTYNKIVRTVAFIYRMFIKRKTKSCEFTSKELQWAFLKIIEAIQKHDFSQELALIASSKQLQSSLQKLSPFLHSYRDGRRHFSLLRVGGRLLNSPDSYEVKFPLLIKNSNKFALLYLKHLHVSNCHVGPKNLVCLSRQKVWIVNARELARKIVKSCVHCFKYKPVLLNQIMGNLPADRLRNVRPFLICGVDFCGPVYTTHRIRGRPPYKTYVAIFVCFTSRAVHIDAVSDLSTNSFLLLFKRFVGRRGLPEKIYCDNATNFVGASNEIEKFREQFLNKGNIDSIHQFAAERGTKFVFIPPRAPHFGGLWEAAVKSTKRLLVKTVANANLTYEELATVLVEIEAILNTRPISPSDDPNDGEALTPGHLLIGTALVSSIEAPSATTTVTYAKRWQLISRLKAQFWCAFRREYFAELQSKAKWCVSQRNIDVGDIVMIHEDNMPSQKWLMGRIVAVVLGPDGKVRVADVKTKSGVLRRSIHKLALIPTISS